MSFAEIAALTIHDVKNSLAQLAGQAEARGDVATLLTALNASEALTRLLIFYKSETSILRLAVDAHAPADLLVELGAENQSSASIMINIDCASAPTLWFYDETLVRMLLSNALQNALRYAHSHITLAARELDEFLEFVVHDDGDGYAASVLADTGASAAITPEGTGLGLRLALRIAELHENAGQRGTVILGNENGAVFILRLPK
ncbi:MAG: ATP-binding protein [Undibacterium sp.]|nr:ATP-binding protein [Undibacterium sp.]